MSSHNPPGGGGKGKVLAKYGTILVIDSVDLAEYVNAGTEYAFYAAPVGPGGDPDSSAPATPATSG